VYIFVPDLTFAWKTWSYVGVVF